MSFLLGLDYGTGGAKGCIIDIEGNVMGYSFQEYPIINQKPGWSEHNATNYWTIACEIIKDCITQGNVTVKEIKGITISSALPCMVMVDKKGNIIQNAYNLMDRRAVSEVEFLKEKYGEKEIFNLTGNRLDDHPSIVNLLWEKRNRPQIFNQIDKIMTIEGFLNFKLTGKKTLVHQNAAFVGFPYNIRKKRFEENYFDEIGINQNLFPELRYSDEIIGDVTNTAATETGLAVGTPVTAGQADFNGSCLGSGVINEGDMQCNLGTCGNFGVIHKNTDFMYEMIAMGFTVGCRDTYITIPTTLTGGMSLRFLRDAIGQMEVAAANSLSSLNVDAYDIFNIEASQVPLGSEGLIVLPFLMGERTPIWDSNARGTIFGLSLNHKKGHLIRATMEGVAFAMYDSFRLIKKAGMNIGDTIVMHEGGAKSVLWRKILTDVFNTSTVLTERRTGAPFGDAICAGVVTGLLKDFSVSKDWARYVDRMEPDEKNHHKYMEYFDLYKSLYGHLKEDYKSLRKLMS